MNIQQIKNGIVTGATVAYQAVKGAVLWSGYKIQAGFNNYIVPTIKALWALALAGFTKIGQFLKTTTGISFGSAIALLIAGGTLLKLSQSEDYDDRPGAKLALTAFGLSSIALATIATAIGISAIAAV